MNNGEIEALLTKKVHECAAGKHLPLDFSDRLVRQVHHRRVLRIKLIAVILALSAIGAGVVGYFRQAEPQGFGEAVLLAMKGPTKTDQLSGWMLLGCLRECFKRGKTSRKKDEEEFPRTDSGQP